MMQNLLNQLEVYLREKHEIMNPRFEIVDSFSENSDCTHITLLCQEFPFYVHIHHNDLIDVFELKMSLIELNEEIDMALWFALNPKYNIFHNFVAKETIDNISIIAEEFSKYINDN